VCREPILQTMKVFCSNGSATTESPPAEFAQGRDKSLWYVLAQLRPHQRLLGQERVAQVRENMWVLY
jgi:hypothetical protein